MTFHITFLGILGASQPTHELSIPCLLEHMRGAMGDDSQPAVPAEPKDPGDEMIEAAIRSIEADDEVQSHQSRSTRLVSRTKADLIRTSPKSQQMKKIQG